MEKRERKGARKICNSCNFHGKFATPRELRMENREPGKDNTTYSCVLGSVL